MNPVPTPITNRLRRARGDSDATLHLLHHVGRVELYARQRPRRPLDYAVVRGRLVGHGATPGQALDQVRTQLAQDPQPLSWRSGLEAGFTSTCLATFCQANGLHHTDTLTRAELQRVAAQHLDQNWPHYARGLRRVGIHLKPPPTP